MHVMQKLCKNYALYALIMQKLWHRLCTLCKNYAKITQKKLRKNYAYVCKLHNLHYYAPPTLLMSGLSKYSAWALPWRARLPIPTQTRCQVQVTGACRHCQWHWQPEPPRARLQGGTHESSGAHHSPASCQWGIIGSLVASDNLETVQATAGAG